MTPSARANAFLQRADDALAVVADRRAPIDPDANLRQPRRQPRRVRVHNLTQQQLRADGDDFNRHQP
jgi:hypothetical protein